MTEEQPAETPSERRKRLCRERCQRFRAKHREEYNARNRERLRQARQQAPEGRLLRINKLKAADLRAQLEKQEIKAPDPQVEPEPLEDPDFLENDLPAWPEEVLETVAADFLTEHPAILQRRASGFVLSYPIGRAIESSATSIVMAKRTPAIVEASIPPRGR